MSAKRKAATKPKSSTGPSMIALVLQAVPAVKAWQKGASRAAIANWILANTQKTAGGRFNATLRRALATCMEKNLLKAGTTSQRYKLGEAAKSFGKKKKVVKKKKKVTKKKKKVTKKKKKTTKKKKKVTKKKKKVTKKKTTKKSKKKVSKKKKVTKKKGGKKR